jgi:inner membrane protein
MDNISHSLASLMAGELIHRALPSETNPQHQKIRRRLLLTTAWAAGNFPDLDIVLSSLLPSPIGYLLHHRGHTHTILYSLPQALLLFAILWLLWPSARRLLRESRQARKGLVGALVAGFGLHLFMDYLNLYGIHPFHPFNSSWYFGDLTFIIEPFFWVTLGVPLALLVRRLWLRTLWVVLLLGLPLLVTILEFLTWGSFAFLTLCALLLGGLHRKWGAEDSRPLILGFAGFFVYIALQGLAGVQARASVHVQLQSSDPQRNILDVAMAAFPSNPLCWFFVSMEELPEDGSYQLYQGVLALAPGIQPASQCPQSLLRNLKQVSQRSDLPPATEQALFLNAASGDIEVLRNLKESNCFFEAWLRFARMPVLDRLLVASDFRFEYLGDGVNFTRMDLKEFHGQQCPGPIPPWDFPRRDLLAPQ